MAHISIFFNFDSQTFMLDAWKPVPSQNALEIPGTPFTNMG